MKTSLILSALVVCTLVAVAPSQADTPTTGNKYGGSYSSDDYKDVNHNLDGEQTAVSLPAGTIAATRSPDWRWMQCISTTPPFLRRISRR